MATHQIAPADSMTPGSAYVQASSPTAAGEYLTLVGGCGDCHTAQAAPGDTTDHRFAGNPVGYRGPWGTSYAANLRLATQHLSEDRWVSILKTHNGRPPMPWENLHHVNERDLRAIYQYIRSLGPAGSPMPRAVPPGQEPKTPYIDFTPKQGS
jgi:mono/diheme cytochrome c family protein